MEEKSLVLYKNQGEKRQIKIWPTFLGENLVM